MTTETEIARRITRNRTLDRLDLSGGRIFHKKRGESYASGANRKRIREVAKMRGVVGIDLDINPNAEGTPWVHHQLHPTKRDAWFDPKGKIHDGVSCRDLDDTQMGRLRVRYHGRWAMLNARQAAEECARAKGDSLIPMFEAKFLHKCYEDPQWWYDQFVEGWPLDLRFVIATLPGTQGGRAGLRKLAAAHEVGLPTMWLWRGEPPAGYRNHVDLVKSRPRRGIYRP